MQKENLFFFSFSSESISPTASDSQSVGSGLAVRPHGLKPITRGYSEITLGYPKITLGYPKITLGYCRRKVRYFWRYQ